MEQVEKTLIHHVSPAADILNKYNVDPLLGLTEKDAQDILERNGPNRLKPPAKPSRLKIFLGQVANAMTIVLIAAMAVSFGTQDWIAGSVIAALVILNVSVGYSQEWKAEKTLAALESVGSPVATVVRHESNQGKRVGKIFTIPTEQVVVGDIILIKIGDVVPADARIIPDHISNLECDEALLTGESLPVGKISDTLDDPDCPVGDRINMVYSGSQVTKGRARAIVVTTGMDSELGKIAAALERKDQSSKTGLARFNERFKVAIGISGTTPLQIKLNKLAYLLLLIAVLLAVIVVSSTGYKDIPNSVATYAVAAAVSLLPASLVAVVSLTLASACRELAKRNALVRRMDAVETIGGVSDICSDKTGTITLGRMVLRKAWVPVTTAFPNPNSRAPWNTDVGQIYEVESGQDPFYPRGAINATDADRPNTENEDGNGEDDSFDNAVSPGSLEPSFQDLVCSAALNNMATLRHEPGKEWTANGDPTEIALQVFAHKAGYGKPHLTKMRPAKHHGALLRPVQSRASASTVAAARDGTQHNDAGQTTTVDSDAGTGFIDGHYKMIVEHPFDSTIKRMSTVWQFVPQSMDNARNENFELVVYLKGAVERVLDRCTYIGLGPDRIALKDEMKQNIIDKMNDLAEEGLRVLCLAGKMIPYADEQTIKALKREDLELECGVLGLVGIYDPPRPESKGAVMDAHRAGIVPRMLTGDHAATAASIAKSVGILAENHSSSAVMTGQQFDGLSDAEIDALEDLPVVVARCSPETKVRMISALHRRKRKTVMTGDGVNDSPALKRADVGVAMGLNGSDVAKGASDVVLSDDNFSTIVRAIRKGRSVFQNLSKFLVYLLSGNVAEVVVLMLGLAFRKDGVAVYPISPVAALWINTIAAGPPALALGVEPTAKDTMDLGPEEFQKVFTASWTMDTIGYGVFMGAQALVNFVIVQYGVGSGATDIETKCNDALVGLQEGCSVVFRARGTAFATLQIILMLHAITCKNMTRSVFHMNLLENTTLLWTSLSLALVTFPIVYIPEINDRVFQVSGLTWHWGLVFAQVLLYICGAELYKLARRHHIRQRKAARREHPAVAEGRRKGVPLENIYTV